MTLTKIYECDLCKKDAPKEDLLTLTIVEPMRSSVERHAHKECLIKIGLLEVQEPPVIQPNVFLELAEGATAASAEKTFLDTEEGPPLSDEDDDNE